jgi:hypothetical protein
MLIFKTLLPFKNYGITPCGKVKNLKTGRFLAQMKSGDGYLVVTLISGYSKKRFRVHRLVAELYIPNPNGFQQVNHKDLNKENNNALNLEWCTPSQNVRHAVANGRISKPGKPVYQLDLSMEIIRKYDSVSEAAQYTKIDKANINCACRGERHTAGGYYWILQEEYADAKPGFLIYDQPGKDISRLSSTRYV